MSDVVLKSIELLEHEISQHKKSISELEGVIKAIRAYKKEAKPVRKRRTLTAKPKAAARAATKVKTRAKRTATPVAAKTRKGRKPSYVTLAEGVLRKSSGPMRMVDLINSIMQSRPSGGKYAVSAARQAITNAAAGSKSRIVRAGQKGSGMYGLSPSR
jgi:type VI protein secretion system component VasK